MKSLPSDSKALWIINKMSWKSNIQSKSRNVFIDQLKYNYSIYPDYKEEIIIFCLISKHTKKSL